MERQPMPVRIVVTGETPDAEAYFDKIRRAVEVNLDRLQRGVSVTENGIREIEAVIYPAAVND
jgi:hypothetical protein